MGLRSIFCKHDWEILDKRKLTIWEDPKHDTYPIEHRLCVVQVCKKCGKIKKTSIRY